MTPAQKKMLQDLDGDRREAVRLAVKDVIEFLERCQWRGDVSGRAAERLSYLVTQLCTRHRDRCDGLRNVLKAVHAENARLRFAAGPRC